MGLYKKITASSGSINRNESKQGLPIEKHWQAIKNNPSTQNMIGKETGYSMDTIPYGTDIRANKWDKAISETNKVTRAIDAARNRKLKKRQEEIEKMQEEQNKNKEGYTASSEKPEK